VPHLLASSQSAVRVSSAGSASPASPSANAAMGPYPTPAKRKLELEPVFRLDDENLRTGGWRPSGRDDHPDTERMHRKIVSIIPG
jgi:hypothetical protein